MNNQSNQDDTRSATAEVVLEYLLEAVEGLEPEMISEGVSMRDLGANSLDIVEVVSLSMRELRVKIPRAALSELTTLGQFIDLLHATRHGEEPVAAKAS